MRLENTPPLASDKHKVILGLLSERLMQFYPMSRHCCAYFSDPIEENNIHLPSALLLFLLLVCMLLYNMGVLNMSLDNKKNKIVQATTTNKTKHFRHIMCLARL